MLVTWNIAAWSRVRYRRRKDAYETLHPETKHGTNQHLSSRQVGDSSTDRFTADTAARTGQSERVVQRDAERGEKVCDEAKARFSAGNLLLDAGTYFPNCTVSVLFT